MTVENATYLGEQTLSLIEDAPERAWKQAAEFLEDVQEKVKSVLETIEQTQHCTDRQGQAMRNWHDAVAKWHNADD